MKYCKECHVNIITPVSKCPLCKATTMNIGGPEIRAYPDLSYSEQTPLDTGLFSAAPVKQPAPA